MTKDEALKMALEALKGVLDDTPKVLDASIAGGLYEVVQCRDAICAIKEALAQPERSMKVEGPLHVVCQCDKCKAQPEQEPVAWWNDTGTHIDLNVSGRGTPLYTTPPQRKPQEFVCSTGLCHYRKPLTNDRAHQILLDMAKHIETFGDENITEQALSAECIRFILERVTAYGIKEEV